MAIGHTTFLLHLLQPSLDTWTYFLNAIPALYFNIYLAYVSATAKSDMPNLDAKYYIWWQSKMLRTQDEKGLTRVGFEPTPQCDQIPWEPSSLVLLSLAP